MRNYENMRSCEKDSHARAPLLGLAHCGILKETGGKRWLAKVLRLKKVMWPEAARCVAQEIRHKKL